MIKIGTISVSLICANDLYADAKYLSNKADYFHFDIMSLDFSSCEGLNPELLRKVKAIYSTKLDVHIMSLYPQRYIDLCILNKADIITVHVESNIDIDSFVHRTKTAGLMAGIAVAPKTPLKSIYKYLEKVDVVNILTVEPGPSGQQFQEQQLNKIVELKKLKNIHGFGYMIEVDGSCNTEHYLVMKKAGVDIFVVGASGLFLLSPDITVAWKRMLDYMISYNI